jgi:hypothetical protein
MKQYITFNGPVLPGSITTALSQCGKPKCACKGKSPRLHGPYYRWTGFVDGKRTTKTVSKVVALECKRRIQNYRRLQRIMRQLILVALDAAPWTHTVTQPRKPKGAV